jgi:DNA repair protein RecN (Recombination protein N)
VQDIAQTISSYKDNIEIDPQTLDDILSRQEKLRKLKLKYGPTLEDVLAFADNLKNRIADLEDGGQNIEKFEAELEIALKKLLSLSEGLHNKRVKAAQHLSKEIVKEIAPLGFEQVRFEVSLEQTPQAGPKGIDAAEFLFSSNPGQGLRPLRSIASGGEISRLMLGLKTVLAGGTPLMVFDEIDAGISGQTGKLVGRKLKKVSGGRQVLCVTHLAQVAVFADRHFTVEKLITQNNTEVKVTLLEDVDKVREIARMIGSSRTASAGFKHAQDLLLEAQS